MSVCNNNSFLLETYCKNDSDYFYYFGLDKSFIENLKLITLTNEKILNFVKRDPAFIKYLTQEQLNLEIMLEALKLNENVLTIIYKNKFFNLCKELYDYGYYIENINLNNYWFEDFNPIEWFNKELKKFNILEKL